MNNAPLSPIWLILTNLKAHTIPSKTPARPLQMTAFTEKIMDPNADSDTASNRKFNNTMTEWSVINHSTFTFQTHWETITHTWPFATPINTERSKCWDQITRLAYRNHQTEKNQKITNTQKVNNTNCRPSAMFTLGSWKEKTTKTIGLKLQVWNEAETMHS